MVIADYDPIWPEVFRAERQLLFETSGASLVSVEHMGSTSVPGLAAKPIIDIMGGVDDLTDADELVPACESIGYEYVPEYEDPMPDRRYFRKPRTGGSQMVRFHLHVVEIGSAFWVRQLLFRDYLRSHPTVADDYASLKRRLAVKYVGNQRSGYSGAKTDFVESILDIAAMGHTS